MPEKSEYVGANMVEYEMPDGSHILVHPDDLENFDKQVAAMRQGANDAVIMQKLREQHAGDAQPMKATAAPKRVGTVDTASAGTASESATESKASEPAKASKA